MKVSSLLAHEIHRELEIAVGLIDLGQAERARAVLLKLSELVSGQTVLVVDNCEVCGLKRVTMKKKIDD